MAAPTHVVDTYQINVGAGDASIHILALRNAQTPPAPNPGDRGQVVRAILIDGGQGGGIEEYLKKTIETIEERYTFPPPATSLQFDAVVVTHWDGDHYDGQVKLFAEDLRAQYLIEEAQVSDRLKNDPSLKPPEVDLKKLKCRYFKFDDTTQAPLTTFYCPTWDGDSDNGFDGILDVPNAQYKGHAGDYQLPNSQDRLMSIQCGAHIANVGVSVRERKKRKAAGKSEKSAIPNAEILHCPAQCVLHYGPAELLGRELFYGCEMAGKPHWSTVQSPVALLQTHQQQIALGRKPGLYCVAAQRQIMGKPARPLSGKDADSPKDVGLDPAHTLTNAMSIAMLVIHPSAPLTDPPKISLYTGGDGEGDIERRIKDFLNGYEVTVLKAGHHGSAAGTDLGFFEAIKPSAVVFSAGNDYGHPHWSKLAFMHAYYSANATTTLGGPVTPVWSTCYPSWFLEFADENDPSIDDIRLFNWALLKTEDGDKDVSAKAKTYKYVLDTLRDRYDFSNSLWPGRALAPLADIYREFVIWTKDQDLSTDVVARKVRAEARYWFSSQIWPSISSIQAIECSSSPALANGQKVSPVDRMRHLYIQHGKGRPVYDGTVTVEKGGVWNAPNTKSAVARANKDGNENHDAEELPPTKWDAVDDAAQKAAGRWPKRSNRGRRDKEGEGKKVDPLCYAVRNGTNQDLDEYLAEMQRLKDEAEEAREAWEAEEAERAKNKENDDEVLLFARRPTTIGPLLATPTADAPAPYTPRSVSVILSPGVAPDKDTLNTGRVAYISIQSPLFDFVNGLALQGIWLLHTAKLEGDNIQVNAQVTPRDATFDWLHSSVFAKKLEFVIFTHDENFSDEVQIAEGRITLEFPGQSDSDAWSLDFTTHSTAIASNFGGSLPDVEDTGSLTAFAGMLWAVPATITSSTVPLVQVFKAFDIVRPLLTVGLGDVQLQLDMTPRTVSASSTLWPPNAIWLLPNDNSLTMLKLSFKEQGTGFLEQKFKEYIPGVTVSEVCFHMQRSCGRGPPTKDARFTLRVEHSVTITAHVAFPKMPAVGNIMAAVKIGDDFVTASLTWNSHEDPFGQVLQTLIDWLNARISSTNSEASKLENDNFSGWLSALGDGAAKSAVSLRRLTLKYSNRLQAFRVDLQVDISAGAPKGQKVPLMVYFTWERGLGKGRWNLTGEIWPKVKLPSELPPTHFHPDYDALQDLSLTGASYVYKLSLLHLDPATELKESDVPRGIPTEIVKGRLSITNDSVTIYADIQCLPLTKDVEVPCIALQGLQLNAVYHYGATKGFDLSLHGQVALAAYNASRTRTSDKTYLDVTLSHAAADQSWTMYASIMGVHMSALHKFFAPEERGAVMEFMDKFYLPFMQIEYKYVSGLPSRFTMLGQLVMGGMELDFEYTHLGSEWSFAAALGAAKREQLQERLQAGGKQSTTVRSLLSDIDAELLDYVPDLVADVSLDLQEELAVSVLIERQPSGADEKARLLFLVTVELKAGKLGSFHFTFAQLQAKASAAANAKAAKPLRMFKISLDSFDLSKIELDLVGKLEQPFESLDYVWASEDVDRQTMTFLNTEISRPRPKFTTGPLPSPFRFKDNMSTSDAKSVLCKAGSHFLLVMKRAGKSSVVADCMFGSAPPTTKPAAGVAKPSDNERALKGAGDLQEAPVNHSSSFGLSLTSIGMKMGNRVFHIVMTAKIKLGPIEVMLIGLDLKLDLTNAKSLRDWDRVGISASIQGLALEFNQPPVVLAGLFRKIDTNNFHGYGGGIDVGIAPYEFLAAGMYGEGDGPPKFTSVFVFARLNGPLIELEFAEINGICGGFGYNSALRLPEVSQVTQFPFLSSSAGTKPDPIDQLNAFTSVGSDAWITPSPGSLWFAAGLGIKAFQMVEIQAVITVGLGSNVQLGLVAEAVAKLPKGVKNDNEVFLLVDFVLAATLDFGAGKLAIAGELTPSSFVLHPSCHLTGGFALSYWFENSGHEGDWVFTIGGFHPQFAIPDHYPTAPPRLGISWRYDEHLYLLGEAYFAITPRECMAGFLLAARFEMDSLSAHFDAHADLLVNYEPFQFHGEAVVSVGVSYDLGFGALSKRINAEIGATVKFHGPPLAGTAHIDLEIFSVDINFGPAYQPKPPITLDMFWDMLAQHKDTSVFHLLHAESGQEASDNAKTTAQATEPWRVRGGQFSFRVQLRAVVNRARLVKDASSAADEVTTPAKPCARLLRRDGNTLVSSVKVTVSSKDGSVVPFRLPEPVKKPMPIALWGEYNAFNDPDPSPTEVIAQVAAGGPSGPSHSQDATVEQIAALKILPPTAKLTGDIPSFNAMDAFQSDITTEDGKSPEIPAPKMSAAQQLVRDVSSPKQLEDVRTAWGTPDEKLGLNRHELLSLFTSLVSDTGDGKRAKRYAGLKMAPPKQLLAEMPDLYSAAPSLVDYGMPIPVHG